MFPVSQAVIGGVAVRVTEIRERVVGTVGAGEPGTLGYFRYCEARIAGVVLHAVRRSGLIGWQSWRNLGAVPTRRHEHGKHHDPQSR